MAIFEAKIKEIKKGLEDSKDEANKKKAEKARILLKKHGFDIENYSEEELNELNAKTLRKIGQDLLGKGLMKAGLALSLAKAADQLTVGYLSILVEQGWIQMRQNEIIIREIKEISKNGKR